MSSATTKPPEAGQSARDAWRETLRRMLARLHYAVASDAFRLSFAVAVFLGALWLLRREVQTASPSAIQAAFRATPPWAIGAAVATTLLSYLCLAASEQLALGYLGRRLAAWRVILVTFVSYALSNGLGFSLATGAAARLRFYRAWGLGGSEIGAVTLLAGAAVTLSGAVAAGLALLAIPGLPPPLYGLAAILIAPAGLWIARLPKKGRLLPAIELATPSLKTRLGALGGGLLDWALSGLALFVLLPGASADQFAGFLAVFILGSVVSAASGVPGGVGVFEAVVLSLSHRFALPHETVAALILYRLIYAVGPLSLTALGLGAYQLGRLAQGRASAGLRSITRALAPPVVAGLAFWLGAGLLLASANLSVRLTPASSFLAAFPSSHLVSSILGVLLLLAAISLWRRLEAAYVLTLLLVVGGAAFELWKGLGLASAAPLLLLGVALAPCQFAFRRRSAAFHDVASAPWFAACGLAGASAFTLALTARQAGDHTRQPWWALLRGADAAGPVGVAAGLAALGLLVAVWRLLSPSRSRAAPSSPKDIARAKAIIAAAKAVSCDAFLALLGDKSFVFSPSGRSFVMHRPIGAHWIAMSDPVGPPDDRPAMIDAFVEAAADSQASPVFYALDQNSVPDLIDAGFLIHKIGESALVDLAAFSLQGKAREDLRHAVNHAQRTGLAFEILEPNDPLTPWTELKAVSDAWLAAHHGHELSFTLGCFDPAYLLNFPIAMLRGPDGVSAFANLVATPDGRRLSVDLMRHRPSAQHGVMDALFVSIILWGQARGFAEFDLGMAPLSGLESHSVAPLSRRVEAWVYRSAERVYGFQGLRAYKQKFGPHWRPVFLATSASVTPAVALAEVGLLTQKGLAARSIR